MIKRDIIPTRELLDRKQYELRYRRYRKSLDQLHFLRLATHSVPPLEKYQLGQFVHLDGSGVGVVARLPNDDTVPDEHLGVWFGTCDDAGAPIICTVPAEYVTDAPTAVTQH